VSDLTEPEATNTSDSLPGALDAHGDVECSLRRAVEALDAL
jgi:hypothetical protein